MIPDEQVAKIRHLFHAEHWKIGTIAAELRLHPDTVRAALETERFRSRPRLRDRLTDPYLDFLRQTLQQYPRLRATRLFQMIRARGYTGSVTQLRRVVAEIRPPGREAFLRLQTFPRRASPSRLGLLQRSHRRSRLPPPLRLRLDPLVQPCLVAGILLRSNLGELPPWSCPRLPRLGWSSSQPDHR